MKCSFDISYFLEAISSLSHSIVLPYFFALITEEGFLISPCYPLELCIQMGISFLCLSLLFLGLPFGSAHKESACNVGDLSSIPGLGRSSWEGKVYPLQYSGLENSMDCIVHGVAKCQTQLSDFHCTSLTSLFSTIRKASQTTIFHFCISFSWGWFWSLPAVQCYNPLYTVNKCCLWLLLLAIFDI